MYWSGAVSAADEATTVVYSMAPNDSRRSTTWRTVESFCPMAT